MPDNNPQLNRQLTQVVNLLKSASDNVKQQDAKLKAQKADPAELVQAFQEIVGTLGQVVQIVGLIALQQSKDKGDKR